MVWRPSSESSDRSTPRQRTCSTGAAVSGRWRQLIKRCCFIVICCLTVAACGGEGGAAYKARLVGTWVSDHPRYEGCQMVITKDRMVFQAADGTLRTNAIADIGYTNDAGAHLLRLEMTEGGEQAFTMSFILETGPGGDILRFRNQPQVVWEKSPSR